jgi:glucosylceramidase
MITSMGASAGRAAGGLIAVVALALTSCGPSGPPMTVPQRVSADVYVTSQSGDRITRHPAVWFAAGGPTEALTVRVDDGVRYQKMAGFGASFLEAGLVTLNTLPDKQQQDAVLRKLFDPRDGAGFSVMKTVLGSTDFQSASQDWFTYDDTPDDLELTDFSIARDLAPTGAISYIRRAR